MLLSHPGCRSKRSRTTHRFKMAALQTNNRMAVATELDLRSSSYGVRNRAATDTRKCRHKLFAKCSARLSSFLLLNHTPRPRSGASGPSVACCEKDKREQGARSRCINVMHKRPSTPDTGYLQLLGCHDPWVVS